MKIEDNILDIIIYKIRRKNDIPLKIVKTEIEQSFWLKMIDIFWKIGGTRLIVQDLTLIRIVDHEN